MTAQEARDLVKQRKNPLIDEQYEIIMSQIYSAAHHGMFYMEVKEPILEEVFVKLRKQGFEIKLLHKSDSIFATEDNRYTGISWAEQQN